MARRPRGRARRGPVAGSAGRGGGSPIALGLDRDRLRPGDHPVLDEDLQQRVELLLGRARSHGARTQQDQHREYPRHSFHRLVPPAAPGPRLLSLECRSDVTLIPSRCNGSVTASGPGAPEVRRRPRPEGVRYDPSGGRAASEDPGPGGLCLEAWGRGAHAGGAGHRQRGRRPRARHEGGSRARRHPGRRRPGEGRGRARLHPAQQAAGRGHHPPRPLGSPDGDGPRARGERAVPGRPARPHDRGADPAHERRGVRGAGVPPALRGPARLPRQGARCPRRAHARAAQPGRAGEGRGPRRRPRAPGRGRPTRVGRDHVARGEAARGQAAAGGGGPPGVQAPAGGLRAGHAPGPAARRVPGPHARRGRGPAPGREEPRRPDRPHASPAPRVGGAEGGSSQDGRPERGGRQGGRPPDRRAGAGWPSGGHTHGRRPDEGRTADRCEEDGREKGGRAPRPGPGDGRTKAGPGRPERGDRGTKDGRRKPDTRGSAARRATADRPARDRRDRERPAAAVRPRGADPSTGTKRGARKTGTRTPGGGGEPTPSPPFTLPPHLEGLDRFEPGKPIAEVQRELGLERVVKLASNENPLGPSSGGGRGGPRRRWPRPTATPTAR